MTIPRIACLALLLPTAALARPLHVFEQVVLSANGRVVASIEHDEADGGAGGDEPVDSVVIRGATGDRTVRVALPCGAGPACVPSDLALTPDGNTLAFVLHEPNDPSAHLLLAGTNGSAPVDRLAFRGTLGGLRYAPNSTLAMLAVAGAHKEVGAVKAAAPLSGEVGVDEDEQRIAVLEPNGLAFVSPANLFVYEFDWRPDASGFVGTAAPGNGDDGWWKARLWTFPRRGAPAVLYAPPPTRQLAMPRVSPDGTRVAFVGGIMSDFGSTGGDAFVLPLAGGAPTDLTPGMKASATALAWNCDGDGALTATTLSGGETELRTLRGAPDASPPVRWHAARSIGLGGSVSGVACGGGTRVTVAQDFTHPPEIAVASGGWDWRDLTRTNQGLTVPVTATSLAWRSDGFDVQGWLLLPDARDPHHQKLVTSVHGGPSAASTPHFLTARNGLALLDAGYDLFLPNPRGSFGQGEAFTLANVRDFGHGDLRDILAGVDAAMRAAPIDPDGLGIMGYSYGGYMTMWAVTQTNRFHAAVAGAGVSDWLSYYGENGIDQWMIPFFGASAYDDPAIYAKSSPIDFIKNVRTPTFEYVGDRDVECPLPQTQEFWHALHTLGVPTEFVVYPGQGHGMRSGVDRADATRRTLAWFDRYLGRRS